jgi:hypothetical protein
MNVVGIYIRNAAYEIVLFPLESALLSNKWKWNVRCLATNEVVKVMIKRCVNTCFKNFDRMRFRDSSACYSVRPLKLNWRSLSGWFMRTIKIFAGRNTKTIGIELRIVLRASAISRYELAVLLIARSAFEWYIRQARASVISEVMGGCARPPLADATKGITIDLSTND